MAPMAEVEKGPPETVDFSVAELNARGVPDGVRYIRWQWVLAACADELHGGERTGFSVLALLAAHADHDGRVSCRVDRLAKAANLADGAAASRQLATLCGKGLVEQVSSPDGYGPAVYRIAAKWQAHGA